MTVLVHSGCYNKILLRVANKKARNLFFRALEAGKSEIIAAFADKGHHAGS